MELFKVLWGGTKRGKAEVKAKKLRNSELGLWDNIVFSACHIHPLQKFKVYKHWISNGPNPPGLPAGFTFIFQWGKMGSSKRYIHSQKWGKIILIIIEIIFITFSFWESLQAADRTKPTLCWDFSNL